MDLPPPPYSEVGKVSKLISMIIRPCYRENKAFLNQILMCQKDLHLICFNPICGTISPSCLIMEFVLCETCDSGSPEISVREYTHVQE